MHLWCRRAVPRCACVADVATASCPPHPCHHPSLYLQRTDASGTGEGDVIAGAGWVARPPTGGGTSSTEPKAEEARREAAGGQAAAAEDDEASRPCEWVPAGWGEGGDGSQEVRE